MFGLCLGVLGGFIMDGYSGGLGLMAVQGLCLFGLCLESLGGFIMDGYTGHLSLMGVQLLCLWLRYLSGQSCSIVQAIKITKQWSSLDLVDTMQAELLCVEKVFVSHSCSNFQAIKLTERVIGLALVITMREFIGEWCGSDIFLFIFFFFMEESDVDLIFFYFYFFMEEICERFGFSVYHTNGWGREFVGEWCGSDFFIIIIIRKKCECDILLYIIIGYYANNL